MLCSLDERGYTLSFIQMVQFGTMVRDSAWNWGMMCALVVCYSSVSVRTAFLQLLHSFVTSQPDHHHLQIEEDTTRERIPKAATLIVCCYSLESQNMRRWITATAQRETLTGYRMRLVKSWSSTSKSFSFASSKSVSLALCSSLINHLGWEKGAQDIRDTVIQSSVSLLISFWWWIHDSEDGKKPASSRSPQTLARPESFSTTQEVCARTRKCSLLLL